MINWLRRIPVSARALLTRWHRDTTRTCVLAGGLIPSAALADGLGGLAGLRAMFYMMLAVFVFWWLVAWGAFRLFRRYRDRGRDTAATASRRYWLRDVSIPLGLRILCLAQFAMAFLYAGRSFMTLIFPFARTNGSIATFLLYNIVFGVIFAFLLVRVANGVINRDPKWGYTWGLRLGALAVANPALYWVIGGGFGRAYGPEWFSPAFGLVLLTLLLTRYQDYFGVSGGAASEDHRSDQHAGT